jgi:hypothetical protein
MVEKRSKQNTAEEKLNMQDVLSMRSSGYYSQRTAGAKNAIDSVLPLMKDAVKNLPERKFCGLQITERQMGELVRRFGQTLFQASVMLVIIDILSFFTLIYHQMIFLPCSRRCKEWKVMFQMLIR